MEKVIYKNLNSNCWSVATLSGKRGRGRLERHTEAITLQNVRFNVQPAAREKVAAGGDRSVHAWSIGTVIDRADFGSAGVEITYNPRRAATFHVRANGRPIEFCEYLHFSADGVVMAYGEIR